MEEYHEKIKRFSLWENRFLRENFIEIYKIL